MFFVKGGQPSWSCVSEVIRIQPWLHHLITSFRFLSFLLWFVLGPGGFREAPGGPGNAHGELCSGGSPGAPRSPRDPGQTN